VSVEKKDKYSDGNFFLSNVERTFSPDDIIVTKTDLTGKITYANRLFLSLSDFQAHEVIGRPHNIIRHPDMPKCIFKLLWDTVRAGREIFAYVVNRASNGDHYWVFAHVTPTLDSDDSISGYHSTRRVPNRDVVTRTIMPLYARLLAAEAGAPSLAAGLERSQAILDSVLAPFGGSYEAFIFSL
jgi:PAS domain S-box-containing protein